MACFTTDTFKVYDDYMTPKSAWEAIKDYIPSNKTIWEPFYGNGDSGRFLTELGFNVIHQQEDFFQHNHGDIVVSNPPFSIKKEVIKRLVELDKPFILLMPVSTIVCSYVKKTIGNNLQIIVPKKRIQFGKLENGTVKVKGRCSFECLYYCFKMNLPRDINYLE